MGEKCYRKVRCKTSYGYVVSWCISKQKNDKWRVIGVGSARMGRSAVPSDFLPFEISDVVMNKHKPEFDSWEDAADYVKRI